MSDQNPKHVINESSLEEKAVLSDFVHKGIQLSDDEIAELQPLWDVPNKAVVLADLGHHLTASEVVEEAKKSIRAGASSIHLHIKGEDGSETGDHDVWREVLSEIKEEDPDIVIDAGLRGDTFEEQMFFIREELFDVVPMSASKDPGYVEDVLEVMDGYNVRPRMTVFCPSDVIRAKAHYVETGLIETPAIWAPMIGNPYHGVHMPDAMSMSRILMYMLEQIYNIDEDAFNLVTASNRPSNFLAVLTALYGQHLRVGMGETRWRFPHREEKLEDNETAVRDSVKALEVLGRDPATSSEFRDMIGLD